MRVWIFCCYLAFIFIATCTESLSLLLSKRIVTFHFNGDPSVLEFFQNDFTLQDSTYISQKIGHIIIFFFLGVLVYWVWRSVFLSLIISLAVALSTEVAQLFFSRSGRLLDVGYDMSGVFLFLVLVGCYQMVEFVFNKKNGNSVNRR
ncbi:VanZ family protein [Metabacillus litoralis]|uniref:VanZ family protein n=1 Tax=Metabacillus litoralis TaxID=152268 RepID=UPI001CFE9771|nr:VanZ family protein [Metabacillus litoralis]